MKRDLLSGIVLLLGAVETNACCRSTSDEGVISCSTAGEARTPSNLWAGSATNAESVLLWQPMCARLGIYYCYHCYSILLGDPHANQHFLALLATTLLLHTYSYYAVNIASFLAGPTSHHISSSVFLSFRPSIYFPFSFPFPLVLCPVNLFSIREEPRVRGEGREDGRGAA